MSVFIDSNIPMYVVGKEHPNKAPAKDFLEQVRQNKIDGCSSTEVLQEILYRFSALKRGDLGRQVYDLFVQICSTIHPVSISDTDLARKMLEEDRALGVRDAIHAAVMRNHRVHHIATFDEAFDRIAGIRRYELG